jgi:lysophosphatidate acyltransferase
MGVGSGGTDPDSPPSVVPAGGTLYMVWRCCVSLPMLGLVVVHCSTFALLWSAWKLVSLALPARLYHRGDDFLFEMYQRHIIFAFETAAGLKLYLYKDFEEVLKKKEKILWISNHQSAADWAVLEMLALKQGSLGGVRYILKDSLRNLPLYGWYFPQHNCVYVRRSKNPKDLTDIQRQLRCYHTHRMPLWLVIFPEGTRYNPERQSTIDKSQQFARDQGLEVLKNHLTPRCKATHASIEELRHYVDAIYDVTIGYEETFLPSTLNVRQNKIKFAHFLLGLYGKVHLKITRIDMKDAPEGEDNIRVWLHNSFLQKDRDIDQFYSADKAVTRTFGPNSFCPPRTIAASSLGVAFWCLATGGFLCSDVGFWLWTRGWIAVLMAGPVYAYLKK